MSKAMHLEGTRLRFKPGLTHVSILLFLLFLAFVAFGGVRQCGAGSLFSFGQGTRGRRNKKGHQDSLSDEMEPR